MRHETYVITIPQTPKSVNSGGGGVRTAHWGVALKEKQKWQNWFADEFMAEAVEKGMLFCAVSVTLRFKYRHRRDVENYRHPVIKPLADALVAGHWLDDDTDEWFKVDDFRLEKGVEMSERWARLAGRGGRPIVTSETVIKLEGSYA